MCNTSNTSNTSNTPEEVPLTKDELVFMEIRQNHFKIIGVCVAWITFELIEQWLWKLWKLTPLAMQHYVAEGFFHVWENVFALLSLCFYAGLIWLAAIVGYVMVWHRPVRGNVLEKVISCIWHIWTCHTFRTCCRLVAILVTDACRTCCRLVAILVTDACCTCCRLVTVLVTDACCTCCRLVAALP
jgi:hypothetical protein